ncbi:MAG: NnrS family protein [Ectothiorhodospiraceae bacterium]|nr:NnrS family protein [Ectothiorhodospiraceae bacterium]
MPGRTQPVAAERLLFPLAALQAALIVPASLYGMRSGAPALAGLSSPLGHAHELLFGFALAVVGGYLINRIRRDVLWLLAGIWLMARILFLYLPGSMLATLANVAFAVLLIWHAAPQFLRAAKRWRNRLIGPLLIALGLTAAGYHLAGFPLRPRIVEMSLLLFALLMLFMGGRIIAPAVAGAIERAGGQLTARVQPGIEGSLILLLLGALLVRPLPQGAGISGLMLLIAGFLAAVRLLRWQPWRIRQRPDLLCLILGYAWLAVALGLLGGAWTIGLSAPGAATHALTVGAMGTLTATVMARVRLVRRRLDPAREWSTPVIALLVSLAAVLRVGWPAADAALWVASAAWSAAWLLVLGLFLRVRAR